MRLSKTKFIKKSIHRSVTKPALQTEYSRSRSTLMEKIRAHLVPKILVYSVLRRKVKVAHVWNATPGWALGNFDLSNKHPCSTILNNLWCEVAPPLFAFWNWTIMLTHWWYFEFITFLQLSMSLGETLKQLSSTHLISKVTKAVTCLTWLLKCSLIFEKAK